MVAWRAERVEVGGKCDGSDDARDDDEERDAIVGAP